MGVLDLQKLGRLIELSQDESRTIESIILIEHELAMGLEYSMDLMAEKYNIDYERPEVWFGYYRRLVPLVKRHRELIARSENLKMAKIRLEEYFNDL